MKTLIYILMALIVVVLGVNLSKLDGTHILEGDSSVAVVSILAALCALLLLIILLISRKISEKVGK